MLPAIQLARSLKHLRPTAPSGLVHKPLQVSQRVGQNKPLSSLRSRSLFVSSRLLQLPPKPSNEAIADEERRSKTQSGEKSDAQRKASQNAKNDVGETLESSSADKTIVENGAADEHRSPSTSNGDKSEEEAHADEHLRHGLRATVAGSVGGLPSIIPNQHPTTSVTTETTPATTAALLAKKGKKSRLTSSRSTRLTNQLGTAAAVQLTGSKIFASFVEQRGYTVDDVQMLLHLREFAFSLISSLCTDPRVQNLSNFPSVTSLEQQQVDKAIETLIDRQIERKLELEAFAHLTSTPMSSLMAKGRTAMFNQIGFTLKAPEDHEGYVTHAIERLAKKYNAKVVNFDFSFLRTSENWFTDSLLQSVSSEDESSASAQLFHELTHDDDDFTLFTSVLFDVIQKSSLEASGKLPQHPFLPQDDPAPHSNNPFVQAKRFTNKLAVNQELPPISNVSPSPTPSFVVVLRGIEAVRSFPFREFKDMLRSCRANVLFLELDLVGSKNAAQTPTLMLSPAGQFLGDDEDVDESMPLTTVGQIIGRIANPPPANKTNRPTQHFLHEDPIIMTNRAILDAEKRKAEQLKNNSSNGSPFGRGGLQSLAGLFSKAGESPFPGASSFSSASGTAAGKSAASAESTAAIMAAAEAAAVALATLQRRHVLRENLTQLAACIRASHVILVPNQPASTSTSAPTTSSTPSDVNTTQVSSSSIEAFVPPHLSHLNQQQIPHIPVWDPTMRDLTKYWLTPDLTKQNQSPDSFELTCLLLATQTQVIPNIHRIVREAIKLQDMHQFRSSGTWNHFSPLAGMVVRIDAIENAAQAATLDGTSLTPEELLSLFESDANNRPSMRMPLEIRFLHEALNIELGITDRLKHTPNTDILDTELSNSDDVLLPLARKAYANISHSFPAPRIFREGEVDPQKTYNDQKAREAADEEALQERLSGLKLTAMEKDVLQNYVAPSRLETSFEDIGSLEHAKEELLSLIVPMSLPVFHQENKLIRTPLGILLYGPPGTGKTMLARALAKTANASFIHVSASTIISKWLGDSEGHAAAVFSLARKLSPCLIFIDEVDGLLHSRDATEHESSRRVKNEFFSGWDGLLSTSSDPNMSVTVIAATNRPFDLDNAALRRLPHRVLVNLPDQKARTEILRKTLKDVFIAPVDSTAQRDQVSQEERNKVIEELAALTEGYSGSDLKSVCTRAAQQHVRDFMIGRDPADLVARRPSTTDVDGLTQPAFSAASIFHPHLEVAREFAKRPITMKQFNVALGEISASVNQRSGTAIEMKKWHETYGSKPPGHRLGVRPPSVGF